MLRLVYVADYRYSADLDFSVVGGTADAAIVAMVEVLEAARQHAGMPILELTDGDSPIAYVGTVGRKASSTQVGYL